MEGWPRDVPRVRNRDDGNDISLHRGRYVNARYK